MGEEWEGGQVVNDCNCGTEEKEHENDRTQH